MQTTANYDTFGESATDAARLLASRDAETRPSAIPSLLPLDVIAPVANSIGIQLLQKMGWRQGKGIGGSHQPFGRVDEDDTLKKVSGRKDRRRWGKDVTVGIENVPLHLIQPKTDVFGLGYDPYVGAREFRELKRKRQDFRMSGKQRPYDRGVAFGVGVLEDDDTLGMMDDYIGHENPDIEQYDEAGGIDTETGLPRNRVPHVQKSGLGDRLALQGYDFEIKDDEEEDNDGFHGAGGSHVQNNRLKYGRESILAIQSREHLVGNSLIPGFVRANKMSYQPKIFPPPEVPREFNPVYQQSKEGSERGIVATSAAQPLHSAPLQKVEPPDDPELRKSIDTLAFFVARDGKLVEDIARQTPKESTFLTGGVGTDYYQYKVSVLQNMMGNKKSAVIGRRSAPLTAHERGDLLGETPLKRDTPSRPAEELGKSLQNIAPGDRDRIKAKLGSMFVNAGSEDASHLSAEGGLRTFSQRQAQQTGVVSHRAAPKVVTPADLSRQTAASTSNSTKDLPSRTVEEWRPDPLLCKRLDVPDPYGGRPEAADKISRFRTDQITIPETFSTQPPQSQGAIADASIAADEFLSELANELESAEAGPATMALSEQRPMDLFKMLFEETESEDEGPIHDEEEKGQPDTNLPPSRHQANDFGFHKLKKDFTAASDSDWRTQKRKKHRKEKKKHKRSKKSKKI